MSENCRPLVKSEIWKKDIYYVQETTDFYESTKIVPLWKDNFSNLFDSRY